MCTGVAAFAYLTGWRVDSEVVKLEWQQVDFDAGEVRLDAGTTKNKDGRVFPMTRALLEAQRKLRDAVQRKRGKVIALVFQPPQRPDCPARSRTTYGAAAFATSCALAF